MGVKKKPKTKRDPAVIFFFLTCSTHRIAGRGGEDLRGKVLKRHNFPVVLHDGLQVERPLLVAGSNR